MSLSRRTVPNPKRTRLLLFLELVEQVERVKPARCVSAVGVRVRITRNVRGLIRGRRTIGIAATKNMAEALHDISTLVGRQFASQLVEHRSRNRARIQIELGLRCFERAGHLDEIRQCNVRLIFGRVLWRNPPANVAMTNASANVQTWIASSHR